MPKKFNNATTKILRSKLRKEATLPERLLWNHLRQKQFGYKFRRQYGVGPYVVDFCCPKIKLVIEVDGEIHGFDNQRKKDEIRDDYLKKNAFNIIRYQAKDVLNNIESVCEDIGNYLI